MSETTAQFMVERACPLWGDNPDWGDLPERPFVIWVSYPGEKPGVPGKE